MVKMNNVRRALGIDRLHSMGVTGKGINIAVIDTGIFSNHRDLKNTIIGFKDTMFFKEKPYDDNGHGTHVSGIIAGSGAVSGGVYKGIAPDSGLVVIKALNNNGKGKSGSVLEAIEWILKNKSKYGINIVNISVGTLSGENTKKEETENIKLLNGVEQLWSQGMVVVVAAGNNGPENGTVTIPGICKKVITVGVSDDYKGIGTRSNEKIVNYSGRGPANCIMKPEIVAPGSGIISCSNRINSYASKSGTSMATPVVTGSIALFMSKNPGITNKEVKMALRDSAVDLHYSKHHQGWGMINPLGLLGIKKR